MEKKQWLLCPICQNMTRIKLREDDRAKKLSAFMSKM